MRDAGLQTLSDLHTGVECQHAIYAVTWQIDLQGMQEPNVFDDTV